MAQSDALRPPLRGGGRRHSAPRAATARRGPPQRAAGRYSAPRAATARRGPPRSGQPSVESQWNQHGDTEAPLRVRGCVTGGPAGARAKAGA